MAIKIAKRAAVGPFIVMDVLRAAFEREVTGEDVFHLEVGQPGTPAPAGAIEAVREVLASDTLGYTEALGIPKLRHRISRHYLDYYGVSVPSERVVVTMGASGGFLIAFLSCFDAGDRVGLAFPGYPAYKNILSCLDIEAIGLPAGPKTRYQVTVDMLRTLDQPLDGLIIANPSNPTGSSLIGRDFENLVQYCHEEGIRLISDEIYHGITYTGKARTAADLSDSVIVINSFSKYFSMTGWRVGWMVIPEPLRRTGERLAQNLFISAPAVSQHAAVAAFDCGEELEENVARYAVNRDLLLRELPKAGFDELAPVDGAFYIYADVAHLTNDSPDFCRRLLNETGVAITPGTDFDPVRGNRYVRFSFCGPTEDVGEAADRIKAWLKG